MELATSNSSSYELLIESVNTLKEKLDKYAPKTEHGKTLKEALQLSLKDRLDEYANLDLASIASFFSPYHQFGFSSLETLKQQTIISIIREELGALSKKIEVAPSPIKTRKHKHGADPIDYMTVHEMDTVEKNEVKEIDRYINAVKLNNESVDTLEWWSNNRQRFPNLVQLAKKYLCISTTSVPSESTFSKAGYIFDDKRTNMSFKLFTNLVFLYSNKDA
ncbi:hypothetical protein PPL_04647 [Heterostelium album PN500]|uniref:HAT C-terminal dimerisation domain-containing protein n=1 Tax=Heterostelium pallidum (strain ATCC 26659 / Pp 5 / PN500) TaxID=670386 RepID=D3B856_HETP5|nr:hypothetical protein PPL_04647 [Heterostelium album PN500]EFA82224.1 hypothetical protein PPL_04647 [Heterostelium album PN500]|eukprot:XP_020434341.1 hypothetical protein PPL_04647 [Heterostelium album PN500]